MNKYLLLTTAGAIATTVAGTGAQAWTTQAIVAHTSTGASYCDAYSISWSGNVYAGTNSLEPCGATGFTGVIGLEQGISGSTTIPKKKKKGKSYVDMSDTVEPFYYGNNIADNYMFSTPLKSGGQFTAWVSYSGLTSFAYINGSYTFGSPPAARKGTKSVSVYSKLVAIAKQHGINLNETVIRGK